MNVDLIVALVTLAGTLVVLIWNIIDRRQSAFDARMSQATELLTGKTQRRSAGVAIIEGARGRLRRRGMWRTAMIGLLCAQARYLLQSSGQGKRQDEILNLKRILLLLIGLGNESGLEAEVADIGRWIKDDLRSTEPRAIGVNRGEIEKMVNGSSVIRRWVGEAT